MNRQIGSVGLQARAATKVLAALLTISAFSPLTETALDAASPTNGLAADEWVSINGDSNETGFSPLAGINSGNVARLAPAWTLELPGEASLEAAPVMAEGLVFFTGSYGAVYAVDGVTGKLRWKHDPKIWEFNPVKMNYGFGANRGVAYHAGRIFAAALDGRLYALDAKTGEQVWSVETTERNSPQSITGVPRVFAGKVIIGQGGADMGARGYVTAYDEETGKQVWRFYVVPGSPDANRGDPALEMAAKTWNGEFWKQTGGGGGPWDNITYDAELNRIYVGTANAAPYDPEARSPGGGDNLFTASIVALDASTGKYAWHYQINPRDSWDFDCTQQMTLATLDIGGLPRKVLMQAPKNGFFYVLDRETGKLISAGQIGKQNWADGIDVKTGRPIERTNIRYEGGEAVIYPFSTGAHSFMRMAFNPQTGLVYVPVMQGGTRYRKGNEAGAGEINVGGLNVGTVVSEPGDGKGSLVAWDPVAQKPRWTVPIDTVWNGGTLTTAGNLVFQGTADGMFSAYDARSGQRLWRHSLGMGIIASPSTYRIGNRQYVSILAGYGGSAAILSDIMRVGWRYDGPRRLVTFALDAKGRIPASPKPDLTVNALDNPEEKLDPTAISMGRSMFMACAACHGRDVVGAGGPAPDLRESPIALDPDAFYSVVHEGAFMQRGMPRFSMFDKPMIESLRQYIRAQARKEAASKH